jgi:hypothetical protein
MALDFFINYDIRYPMGKELDGETSLKEDRNYTRSRPLRCWRT